MKKVKKITSAQLVEAGFVMDMFKKFLNNFSKDLAKSLTSFSGSDGIAVADAKKDGDNITPFIKCVDKKGFIHGFSMDFSINDDGTYNLNFNADNGKNLKLENIDVTNIKDTIKDAAKQFFGQLGTYEDVDDLEDEDENGVIDSVAEELAASKKVSVNLSKVVADDNSYSITMGKVLCSEDLVPAEALTIINDVCADDEFCESVPEEGQCYEICEEDDEYIVNPIDEIENVDEWVCLDNIIDAAVLASVSSKALFLNNKDYHRSFNYFNYSLDDMVYQLRALKVELAGRVDIAECHADSYISIDTLKENIQCFIDTMELFYSNFNHDIQYALDGHIRNCKQMLFDIG